MENKKHNQRRRKHRELVGSFFIGNTQKSTCCPEFNMQDFSSKKNLIALFNIMIPPAEQKTSESKQISKLLSSRDVFPGATGSGGSGRRITGPTSGVGACVAAMAAQLCTKALRTPILFCFRRNQKKKGAFLLVIDFYPTSLSEYIWFLTIWIYLTCDGAWLTEITHLQWIYERI